MKLEKLNQPTINEIIQFMYKSTEYNDIFNIVKDNIYPTMPSEKKMTFEETKKIQDIINPLLIKTFLNIKIEEIKEDLSEVKDYISTITRNDIKAFKENELSNLKNLLDEPNTKLPLKLSTPLGQGLGKIEINYLITNDSVGLIAFMPYDKNTDKAIRNYIDYEKLLEDINSYTEKNPLTKKYIDKLISETKTNNKSYMGFNKVNKIYKNDILPKIETIYKFYSKSLIGLSKLSLKKVEELNNIIDDVPFFERNEEIKLFRENKSKGKTSKNYNLIVKLAENGLLPIELKYKSINMLPKEDLVYKPLLQIIDTKLPKGESLQILKDTLHNTSPYTKSYLDKKRVDKIIEALGDKKQISISTLDKNKHVSPTLTLEDMIKTIKSLNKAIKVSNRSTKKVDPDDVSI